MFCFTERSLRLPADASLDNKTVNYQRQKAKHVILHLLFLVLLVPSGFGKGVFTDENEDHQLIYDCTGYIYEYETENGLHSFKFNVCSKIHTGPDKNPTGKKLCTIQIVDEDLTAGTHKRRRKCPTSTFVLDKEGIVDSETYKVPQNEADCTNKHLSAIWMLSSYRPPSSANVGIKYKRTEEDTYGVGSAEYTVRSKTNKVVEVQRKMKYDETRHGSKPQGALERISWYNASSVSVIRWKTGEKEQLLPLSAEQKLTVKFDPIGLTKSTRELSLTTTIRRMGIIYGWFSYLSLCLTDNGWFVKPCIKPLNTFFIPSGFSS